MKRVYFTDFDGTITTKDTTNAMVRAFAREDWAECLHRWVRGETNTQQCSEELFAGFRATPEELASFLLQIPIDPFFPEFCRYVEARREKLYILSDGFDFNIRLILNREGLGHLPWFANRLLTENGYRMVGVYTRKECGRHGTCKKDLVSTLKEQGEYVIYIGDGYSDACACREADLVFAKGELLDYCNENGIRACPFTSFREISEKLKELDP